MAEFEREYASRHFKKESVVALHFLHFFFFFTNGACKPTARFHLTFWVFPPFKSTGKLFYTQAARDPPFAGKKVVPVQEDFMLSLLATLEMLSLTSGMLKTLTHRRWS